jgi:hypothetical protein
VIGESWRSSRNTTKRRVSVDDQLDELSEKVEGLRLDMHSVINVWEEKWAEERKRYVGMLKCFKLAEIRGQNGGPYANS